MPITSRVALSALAHAAKVLRNASSGNQDNSSGKATLASRNVVAQKAPIRTMPFKNPTQAEVGSPLLSLLTRSSVALCDGGESEPDDANRQRKAKTAVNAMNSFNAARSDWNKFTPAPDQGHCQSHDPTEKIDRSKLAAMKATIKDRQSLNKFAVAMSDLNAELGKPGGNTSFTLRLLELAHRMQEPGVRTLTKQHMLLFVEEAIALSAGKLVKMESSKRSDDQRAQTQEVATRVLTEVLVNFKDAVSENAVLRELYDLKDGEKGATKSDRKSSEFAINMIKSTICEATKGHKTPAAELICQSSDILRLPAPGRPVVIFADGHVDAHNHGPGCYHAGDETATRLSTTGQTFQQHGTEVSVDMPIPHTLKHPEEEKGEGLTVTQQAQAYYTDKSEKGPILAEFSRRDDVAMRHFRDLTPAQQKHIHPSMTGIQMAFDPGVFADNEKAAEAFAYNYAVAALKAGDKDIMISFGEITANKPAVPQEGMLSDNFGNDKYDDKVKVVSGVTKIVTGVMKSSQKGAERALAEFRLNNPDDGNTREPRFQHRVCLHTDALPLSDTHVDMRDIQQFIRNIDREMTAEQANKTKGEFTGDVSSAKPVSHQFVLQPAHLYGVSVQNYKQVDRTPQVHAQALSHRELETLTVQADLSWYTATARHISTGMAQFLESSGSEQIQNLGRLIKDGDDLQHNGFSYLNQARKTQSIKEEKEGPKMESSIAIMLASAAQEKSLRIFHGIVGEIFHSITESPQLVKELNQHIKEGLTKPDLQSPGGFAEPGNFLGLLYHLRSSGIDLGVQGKTPFINGSDTLGTLSKYDGDLVSQVDTLQHQSTLAVLASLIIGLKATGDPQDAADADIYQSAYNDIHYGGDTDARSFFAPENHNYKPDVSTAGYTDTVEADGSKQKMDGTTRNRNERAVWQGRQVLSIKPADLPGLGISERVLKERGDTLAYMAANPDQFPPEVFLTMENSTINGTSPLYNRSDDGATTIVRLPKEP